MQETPEFKAHRALEMITGEKTVQQLSKEYGIEEEVLIYWKRRMLEKGYIVFEQGNVRGNDELQNFYIDNKAYLVRMKELRLQGGYSQKEIAEVLKIAQNAYARYENGVNELPIRRLIELCEFYQVSADDMLGII